MNLYLTACTLTFNGVPSNDAKLAEIATKINEMEARIMAKLEEFESALGDIDNATTKIASDLEALRGQIAGQGLPESLENEVLSKLQASAARLKGIAADPENPVPTEPTEPAPPTEPQQ